MLLHVYEWSSFLNILLCVLLPFKENSVDILTMAQDYRRGKRVNRDRI